MDNLPVDALGPPAGPNLFGRASAHGGDRADLNTTVGIGRLCCFHIDPGWGINAQRFRHFLPRESVFTAPFHAQTASASKESCLRPAFRIFRVIEESCSRALSLSMRFVRTMLPATHLFVDRLLYLGRGPQSRIPLVLAARSSLPARWCDFVSTTVILTLLSFIFIFMVLWTIVYGRLSCHEKH